MSDTPLCLHVVWSWSDHDPIQRDWDGHTVEWGPQRTGPPLARDACTGGGDTCIFSNNNRVDREQKEIESVAAAVEHESMDYLKWLLRAKYGSRSPRPYLKPVLKVAPSREKSPPPCLS